MTARTALTINKTSRTNKPPANVEVTKQAITADEITNGIAVSDFFNCENPLLVANTSTNAISITLVASTDTNAIKKDIGDYILALGANKTYVIDQIEAGRFMSGSGALNINITAGASGSALGGTIFATGKAKGLG